MKYDLKRGIPKRSFKVFENYDKLWRDSPLMRDLWIFIKCMENIMIKFPWRKALTYNNDDDDHEYYYYFDDDDDDDYHHHHHRRHYHHVPSITYLYVILTLHLNQNHLETSGQNLLSLRKGHLSDWLMKDVIFINWIAKLTEFF